MRRTRLHGQEQKEKMLSQSTYEELCRKVCGNPAEPRRDETVEDAYWRSICLEVSHYLFPNAPLGFPQGEGSARGNIYRITLLRLVDGRLRSSFDPVEIASEYINETLRR